MLSPDQRYRKVTAAERAVLAASARGLDITTVAQLQGHSREHALDLLASAVTKLEAHSTLEAVLVALRYGLIALPDD